MGKKGVLGITKELLKFNQDFSRSLGISSLYGLPWTSLAVGPGRPAGVVPPRVPTMRFSPQFGIRFQGWHACRFWVSRVY